MKKTIIAIVIFFLIGAYLILNSLELGVEDLENKEERSTFLKQFGKWIVSVGKNTKNVVSYVIYLDWLPQNETVSDNERT